MFTLDPIFGRGAIYTFGASIPYDHYLQVDTTGQAIKRVRVFHFESADKPIPASVQETILRREMGRRVLSKQDSTFDEYLKLYETLAAA